MRRIQEVKEQEWEKISKLENYKLQVNHSIFCLLVFELVTTSHEQKS